MVMLLGTRLSVKTATPHSFSEAMNCLTMSMAVLAAHCIMVPAEGEEGEGGLPE